MKKTICAAMGLAATLAFPPPAGADPTPGHFTNVVTQAPDMLCTIGSDDADPAFGPNVVCQVRQGKGFPGSPIDPALDMYMHQAVITAAGQFSYRDANIGTGGDDFHPATLTNGSTYRLQGWTITPTTNGVTFTNEATSHGITIDANWGVKAF
jgi:hypothetical protein